MKFAEEKRVSAERGGRPCLLVKLSASDPLKGGRMYTGQDLLELEGAVVERPGERLGHCRC